MNRRLHCAITSLVISCAALCNSAIADRDLSIVRAAIGSDAAHVAAAGRTRVDVVSALIAGLKDCQVSAGEITVGPWLALPKLKNETENQLIISICVGDAIEGGARTAYIGVTPKAPFKIVAAIAEKLRLCGFTDVRLLSEETVVAEIAPMASPSRTASETASSRSHDPERIAKP